MRNSNRTTKAERRAAKQWNALAARTFGVAEAARYMRDGVLLDEATGLDRLMYATLFDDGYAIAYDTAPVEEITEVRADSPDLPEALRPVVEEFVTGRNADPSDYTVAYRASELAGDTADVLILPKWERGGVLEDYARLHGTAPVIDLAAAPVGAPPFDAVHDLEPGEWQELVDQTRRAPAFVTIPESFGGGTLELYRGDPNERDAARAEAIESALANDYDEDDRHA